MLSVVKDSTELIYHVHEKHDLDIHDTNVKVGFDDGGGCLKVCMIIMAKDHIGMITDEGTSVQMIKKMKINSVKKVIILGAADVKENYFNVKLLFNRVDINSMKVQLAVDLKMGNIILGLQSHSCMHSCYICDAPNPFKPGVDWEEVCECDEVDCDKVKLRTLGSIRDNVTRYRNAGSILSKAKNFKNCVEMPLFEDKDEDGKYKDSHVLTMHLLPPDELHLLLGLNHIYDDLKKVWPDADKWASKCNVFIKQHPECLIFCYWYGGEFVTFSSNTRGHKNFKNPSIKNLN